MDFIFEGTDSRIGFGFAFGNHADFQVVLELGPQINTMNLTGQPFPNNNKRQATALPTTKINNNKEKNRESDAGKYLINWAKKIKSQPKQVNKPERSNNVINLEESVVELVKNEKEEYEIHQPKPEYIPQSVLDNLKIPYDQKKAEVQKMIEKKRTQEKIKKITEDLSNVNMD
ncbi:unnamed protein product [Euphydryas editha]|uniref:Uncharacterized protein n=1 Tax=Euphydryas editha TaxID=104508 RepID=A0AAU9UV83_EUPED|nr:unnamed protein product [Euphydryas editha]